MRLKVWSKQRGRCQGDERIKQKCQFHDLDAAKDTTLYCLHYFQLIFHIFLSISYLLVCLFSYKFILILFLECHLITPRKYKPLKITTLCH